MFDLREARGEVAALAASLAALPAGELSLDEWADLLTDSQALTNSLAAAQAVAISRVVAFDERDLEDGTVEVTERPVGHVALDGPSVVAGRLGCTEQTAGSRVEEAIRVVCDLPEVHAAMAAGLVDAYQAKRVCNELAEAPPAVRRAVSRAIAPWLGRESAPRLAERTRRVLGRIDAELLRVRAARARSERGLFREFGEPGMEQWRMLLPAEIAGPLWSTIDESAQARLAAGEAETIGHARLDAFLAMAMEGVTGTFDVVIVVPGATGDGGDANAAPAGPETPTGPADDVTELVSEVPGGPTKGALARRAAEALAAGLTRTQDSQVEVGGLATTPTAVRASWLRDLLLAGASSASALPGVRVRIRLAGCEPVTGALGQPLDGASLSRDGYRPSARTIAFVKARDRRCRFPGCQVAARFCDVDHVRPWPAGSTDPVNLICLCRRHHRVKQRRRWRVRLDGHGIAHWTDPTGVRRSTAPPDLTGVTLGEDLPEIRHDRGDFEWRFDAESERERASEDRASLLEDNLSHPLIRETGEVPDHLHDLDPVRRGAGEPGGSSTSPHRSRTRHGCRWTTPSRRSGHVTDRARSLGMSSAASPTTTAMHSEPSASTAKLHVSTTSPANAPPPPPARPMSSVDAPWTDGRSAGVVAFVMRVDPLTRVHDQPSPRRKSARVSSHDSPVAVSEARDRRSAEDGRSRRARRCARRRRSTAMPTSGENANIPTMWSEMTKPMTLQARVAVPHVQRRHDHDAHHDRVAEGDGREAEGDVGSAARDRQAAAHRPARPGAGSCGVRIRLVRPASGLEERVRAQTKVQERDGRRGGRRR